MAATTPEFGAGSTIEVDTGAFAAVTPGVTSITPPDVPITEVDRNRLSVVTMKERVFSPRRDPGECSFTYEVDEDNFSAVEALKGDDLPYRVTLSEYGLRLAFSGVLKSNQAAAWEGDTIATATAVIRLTTLITISETVAP
jgi:hypothetical protein